MRNVFLEKVDKVLSGFGLNFNKSENGTISFDISASNCKDIKVDIYIEETPIIMCSIYLQYPFSIKYDYSYFVYKKINEVNIKFKIGTLIYNVSGGSVLCTHTFLCSDSFEDDFKLFFIELLTSFDCESKSFCEISRGFVSMDDDEIKSLSKLAIMMMNSQKN